MRKDYFKEWCWDLQSLFDKSWIRKEIREIMYLNFQKNQHPGILRPQTEVKKTCVPSHNEEPQLPYTVQEDNQGIDLCIQPQR